MEKISPGDTEQCWRLGWFGLSSVKHPALAAGDLWHPAALQLALWHSTLWGCIWAGEPRCNAMAGDVFLLPGLSSYAGCAVRENELQEL